MQFMLLLFGSKSEARLKQHDYGCRYLLSTRKNKLKLGISFVLINWCINYEDSHTVRRYNSLSNPVIDKKPGKQVHFKINCSINVVQVCERYRIGIKIYPNIFFGYVMYTVSTFSCTVLMQKQLNQHLPIPKVL